MVRQHTNAEMLSDNRQQTGPADCRIRRSSASATKRAATVLHAASVPALGRQWQSTCSTPLVTDTQLALLTSPADYYSIGQRRQ